MTDKTNQNAIEMTYRNWRGEVAVRRILPIGLRFGVTDWHPEPGWLLEARDLDKDAIREFALADCDFLGRRPEI